MSNNYYMDAEFDEYLELQGPSAYEVAVENGFKGTEKEWLASLVGAKGEKGEKGDKGNDGGIDSQFVAIYGVTTNAEIEEAYQAKKQVMCLAEGGYYTPLAYRRSATYHEFTSTELIGRVRRIYCKDNAWSSGAAANVNLAGDTMTGALTLAGDPTAPLHAATKQYVDNHVAKITTGTYDGTNASGPGCINSLTFDFVPDLLIIRKMGQQFSMIINLLGATEEYSASAAHVINNLTAGGSSLDSFHAANGLYVKVSGNTVYWYYNGVTNDSLTGRAQQFNALDTYTYMAIG